MNGFLVIDKRAGMSSYDVIRRLKRLHHYNKIGYIGTLDRNATGILPVAINEGAKVIAFLENVTKAYRARFLLGMTTDTLDIEGKVLTETETQPFQGALLEEVLSRFKGKITQQIPMYSSKKVNRKPLYKLARQGVTIEPIDKEVEIFDLRMLTYEHPYVDVDVVCSKGTYIRAVASEFGAILGCGATLYSLKRTRQGEFTEDMGIDIDSFKSAEDVLTYLIPLEKVVKSMGETIVDGALERFMQNGMPVPLMGSAREWKNGEITKLLNKEGALIGIGSVDTVTKTIKIKRLINR